MSWLDRIDEREARRVANALAAGALETRDLAQDHLKQFAQQARHVAEPRLHDAADYLRHARHAAQPHVTDAVGYLRQARHAAEPVLHEAADYLRNEGAVVARAAAKQAGRASRAVRNDPLPTVVGVIGLALLASLVLGRRRT